jgi:hypothetical protein
LPFHDFAVVGDVAVVRDEHNRQLQVKLVIVNALSMSRSRIKVIFGLIKALNNECFWLLCYLEFK